LASQSRLVFLAAILSGIAGCGLSEYQAKMASEQKRIELVDEENKFLGDPLEFPFRNAAPASPQDPPKPDVFLRLPKGFSSKPDDKPVGDFYYHFGRVSTPHTSRYSPSSGTQENFFQDAYVAVAFDNKTDEFSKKVFQPFGSSQWTEMNRVVKDLPGRTKLEYQAFSASDAANPPSTYYCYFYQGPNILVAVIFRVPKDQAQAASVSKGIDYCLQSLAVGMEAGQQRQRFGGQTKPK
jgi:hypothetical protein